MTSHRSYAAKALTTLASLGSLAAVCLVTPTASAEVIVEEYPSADYLATVEPVYYESRATYWWHDHWYYRDYMGWHTYGSEPGFLYDRRMHSPPGRWSYEPHWGGGGFGGRGWDQGGHGAPGRNNGAGGHGAPATHGGGAAPGAHGAPGAKGGAAPAPAHPQAPPAHGTAPAGGGGTHGGGGGGGGHGSGGHH